MQIWSSLRGLDLQSISIIIGRYASCTLPNWLFTYCGWCFFLNWSSSWWPIWCQLIQRASSSFRRTPWPSTVEKWNWSPSCRCISRCHHNTRFIHSRNRKWRAQPSLKLKVCHLSKITLECCFVFRISTTSCRTYWFFVPNSWVSWLSSSHLIRLRLYPISVYPIFLQDILEGFHYKLLQGLILQGSTLFTWPQGLLLLVTSSMPAPNFPLYVLKPSWPSWSLPQSFVCSSEPLVCSLELLLPRMFSIPESLFGWMELQRGEKCTFLM